MMLICQPQVLNYFLEPFVWEPILYAEYLGILYLMSLKCTFSSFNISVPPNIYGSDELAQLTVIEGHLISLLCESSGIPPPNLIWKKKGQFSDFGTYKNKYKY